MTLVRSPRLSDPDARVKASGNAKASRTDVIRKNRFKPLFPFAEALPAERAPSCAASEPGHDQSLTANNKPSRGAGARSRNSTDRTSAHRATRRDQSEYRRTYRRTAGP